MTSFIDFYQISSVEFLEVAETNVAIPTNVLNAQQITIVDTINIAKDTFAWLLKRSLVQWIPIVLMENTVLDMFAFTVIPPRPGLVQQIHIVLEVTIVPDTLV